MKAFFFFHFFMITIILVHCQDILKEQCDRSLNKDCTKFQTFFISLLINVQGMASPLDNYRCIKESSERCIPGCYRSSMRKAWPCVSAKADHEILLQMSPLENLVKELKTDVNKPTPASIIRDSMFCALNGLLHRCAHKECTECRLASGADISFACLPKVNFIDFSPKEACEAMNDAPTYKILGSVPLSEIQSDNSHLGHIASSALRKLQTNESTTVVPNTGDSASSLLAENLTTALPSPNTAALETTVTPPTAPKQEAHNNASGVQIAAVEDGSAVSGSETTVAPTGNETVIKPLETETPTLVPTTTTTAPPDLKNKAASGVLVVSFPFYGLLLVLLSISSDLF